jgi:von Willebrand factor type A domain
MSTASKTLSRLLDRGVSAGKRLPSRPQSAQKLDLVLMFDTTGSMYSYLECVRRKLVSLATEIFHAVPATRIGVIAYGDYCDANSTYVTKVQDLTADVSAVQRFVELVEPTGGGDAPEAVEEALYEANQLSWGVGSRRAGVLIGDAPPHGITDSKAECRNGHYFTDEAHYLAQKNIRIYAVQCGQDAATTRAFLAIAGTTGGKHLFLESIDDLVDLLAAVCMREAGLLQAYTDRLKSRGILTASKEKLLAKLKEE